MSDFLQNMEDQKFRLLMYDDIADMLLKGGASIEMARDLLFIVSNSYKENIREENLETLVTVRHESILEDGGYKVKRNFQQEVFEVASFRGGGLINIADIYNDLRLTYPHEKSACRMAVNRLVMRGMLEKVSDGKSGTYRVIHQNAEETKFLTEPKGEFKMHLPLDLHTMCKIFPQNVVIIAGSKSSGKTTMGLTIAMDNQHRHEVVYLNSEMGDEEFTERMIKMGCNSPADIKFKCYRKSSDFHDMIGPKKAIFIIDFLEIHDEFYKIGKQIKAIHDKLKDGIAIILIQMKSGSNLGRGGDFSKEVSRLYLSMDYQPDQKCTRVAIEEMKSPKTEAGYRGWSRSVKIIDGSRLSPMGPWSDVRTGVGYGEKRAAFVAR
jgi:hypothetical protein